MSTTRWRFPNPRIKRERFMGNWLWCCIGCGLASYASTEREAYWLWHDGSVISGAYCAFPRSDK
jgi:hypothetical protein